MLNKCAKFHKDIPSDKKVKFNLPSAIELSEKADLCTMLFRNLRQASNFGGTFDQLLLWIFYEIFTEDDYLFFLYRGAKEKIKNDQKLKSRGVQANLGSSHHIKMTETYVKEEVKWRTMGNVPLSNSFMERRDARRKLSESLGACVSLAPRTRQRISLGSENHWKFRLRSCQSRKASSLSLGSELMFRLR